MTIGIALAVQVLCAVFFLEDVVLDFIWAGLTEHLLYEASVAIALLIGIGFGAREMYRTMKRNENLEKAIETASGAFTKVIYASFDQWALTESEADVAMFAIKGFNTVEISKIRGTAEGTVRAQLTNIYNKAGVSNRAQFISLFLDELIEYPDTRAEPGK